MSQKNDVLEAIYKTKVIAVLRSKSEEQALAVTRSCLAGGVKPIEITFSTPGADQVIAKITRSREFDDALIGAGTVLDEITARMAIIAGAKFVVGPVFSKEVAKVCNRYSVPYIPGVMTINEIYSVLDYGCELLKLFPASEYKPGFIKAVRGPIPQADFMVTGGISLSNTAEWIAAGATAVGIGGNLTTVKEDTELVDGVYPSIIEAAQNYLAEVAKA